MPFYNTVELTRVSQTKLFSETRRIISESKAYTSFDIFLSHSMLDKEVVKGLFLDLCFKGYKVYVDWIIDSDLDRSNVTKESAELIRNRMKSSKSLLLAISANAATSRWMPWELGFVDGYTGKCGIVPVYKTSYNNPETYNGFEYLKLYPYIKKQDIIGGIEKIWIAESPTKYVLFDNYLNKNEKPYRRVERL